MAYSTTAEPRQKPDKPRPDFPLYAHRNGQWAKKIRGRTHFFGVWADPNAAISLYLEQRDYLKDGRQPPTRAGGLELANLCNAYLTFKDDQLQAGEITRRTFDDCVKECQRMISFWGRRFAVADLTPEEFARFRAEFAKTNGLTTIGNIVTRCRAVFNWAWQARVIDQPVHFGPMFKRPSAKTLRIKANGAPLKLFARDELRAVLESARQPLRAMILLGVNCGFGNTDCGTLPLSAIDWDSAILAYARTKTGMNRRCPLWPETIDALRGAIERRPDPKDAQNEGLVFITTFGNAWAKERGDCPVAKAMARALDVAGVRRPGLSFYALRHTFETVGGEAKDQVAVDSIMGHVDSSMAARYRHGISDERLRAVTDHVHNWLFNN